MASHPIPNRRHCEERSDRRPDAIGVLDSVGKSKIVDVESRFASLSPRCSTPRCTRGDTLWGV